MSISEQVKELRTYANVSLYARENKARELLNQAADTIESLSTKLADMERSAEDCGGWIPCSRRFPENETEVEITFVRKHYKTGEAIYQTARAFYEDGKLPTEKSIFVWNEMDSWEYDEETDSYIIPEGWFESVSFAEEFGIIELPVIAWRYPVKPYQKS